jgi:DNA-binding LacI/PurR family transcriptional regulator
MLRQFLKMPPVQKKPVTLQDIASRLGLTKRAVSQALNEREATVKVSVATREKVQALAKEMGYRYNTAARALTTGRTGMLGILSFQGLMHASAVRANFAIREFKRIGITPLSIHASSGSLESCDQSVDSILDARLDGVLILSQGGNFSESHIHRLKERGVAIVSTGSYRLPGIPLYVPEITEGYEMATRHLIESGYRSITLMCKEVTPETPLSLGKSSLFAQDGFQAAIQKASAKGIVFDKYLIPSDVAGVGTGVLPGVHGLYAPGYLSMWDLIKSGKVPEALVCQVDGWALGAMRACSEAGIRIPHDMAITGYGDDPSSSAGTVPLTSVAEPVAQLCREAVSHLVRTVRENRTTRASVVSMPCELIVRQSSSRAPLPNPQERYAQALS